MRAKELAHAVFLLYPVWSVEMIVINDEQQVLAPQAINERVEAGLLDQVPAGFTRTLVVKLISLEEGM